MANNDIEYKTYTVEAGEESESGSSINTLIKIAGELKTERDVLTKLNPSYTYNEVLKVGTKVLYSVGAMTDTVSSFKVATLKIAKSKTNANGQFLYTYSVTKLDGSIVKVATDVPGVVGGSYNNEPNISLDTIVAKSKEWYGKKLDVKTLQNLNPNILTQMAYIPNNTTVLLEVCAPGTGNSVDIAKFGLMAGDPRNAYVRWEWDHETNKTEGVEVWWSWQSTDGQWYTGSKSTITDIEIFESTYRADDNAVAVKVIIKPITKTGTNTSKKYEWSTECVLNFVFQHWGSFTPSAPQVEIEKYKLTTKYDSLDISDITYEYQGKTYTTKNVTHVQFKVYKNDETKPFKFTDMFPVGLAGEVSYSCSVTAGSKYRAQARCCRITQRGNVYSPWSDLSSFTNTLPIAPALSETKIMNENSVRFKWSKIESATKYVLEYAIKDESIYSDFNSASDYFSAISQSGLIKRVEINALDVSLDTSGKVIYKLAYIENGTYLARVKSVNETESKWSNILEFILGRLPDAPTTWSSTTTVGVGEPLTLYWVHNSTDGSEETIAKIQMKVDDVTSDPIIVKRTNKTTLSEICSENNVTLTNIWGYNPSLNGATSGTIMRHGTLIKIAQPSTYVLVKYEDEEITSFFTVDTSSYDSGVVIKWKVQTAGALKDSGGSPAYGAESMERTIDVYAPPSLEVYLLKYDDSYLDEALNTLPLKVSLVSGNTSSNQKPTGYYVSVVAQSDHTSTDEVGNEISVLKGDKVFSKYYDVSDIEYDIELTAKDLTLVNNQSYKVVCSVAMSSGLMAEAESNVFSVSWVGSGIVPNAEVGIDKDTLTARIRPFANDKTGNSVGNIVNLFVYRREYDGTFTEIVTDTNDPDSGIENDQMTWITDPHPSLDYARYRIVARDKNTGIISYYDTSFAVQEKSVVIQWDEAWQSFDAVDGDVIMTNTEKSYTGSMLKLPYNIDVSNVHSPDVALVRYIGRKRPVSYYGTQLGETATWNVAIPKSDVETLYALRRLAVYMGNVYVREPSGSGYWASINISFSQRHLDLTIPVTINITPVEGGM